MEAAKIQNELTMTDLASQMFSVERELNDIKKRVPDNKVSIILLS